jgi:outer membrane autotransporter protein
MKRILSVGCGFLVSAIGVFGQVVIDDGGTHIQGGDLSLGTNNLIVGQLNPDNSLIFAEGVGVQANYVVLGEQATSLNNTMQMLASSALGATELRIGDAGTGNSFSMASGAAVSTYGVTVGLQSTASDNSITVDGAAATLLVQYNLIVGHAGGNNALNMSDGGSVYAGGVAIGHLSAGNTADVDGGVLSSSGNLVVGDGGLSNVLSAVNAAQVFAYDTYVGRQDSATGNVVSVSGSGTYFQSAGTLHIGSTNNTGNRVTVMDGARLNTGAVEINGTGNGLSVTNGGELVVGSDFDASMTGFSFDAGGRVAIGGALTGIGTLDDGRHLTLYGPTGMWDRAGADIFVGTTSSNSELHVESGASVYAANLHVGASGAASSNLIEVTGSNSFLSVSDTVYIGSSSNTGNRVVLTNGAQIALGTGISIAGTNTFELASGGFLTVSNDFDASITGFSFGEQSTMEILGMLSGQTNVLDGGRTLKLTGASAAWDTGGPFTVGDSSIFVSDGASLTSSNSMLTGAATAVVRGSGSLWQEQASMTIGAAGTGYGLMVSNNAVVGVGDTLSLLSGSDLTINSGGRVMATNYMQQTSAALVFDSVATNTAVDPGTELVSTAQADLDSGAVFLFTGEITDLSVGITNSRKVIVADTLIVGGVTNASGADLEVLSGQVESSLLAMNFYAQNDDLYALILRARLADIAGFADGTDMAGVSDEIDQMATDGDPRAINQLNVLTTLSGPQINAQMSRLYDRHIPTYEHSAGMREGLRQIRNRGIMPDSMWPVGPRGPHFHGDQVQAWVKGYGNWGDRADDGAFSGYEQNVYGMIVGVDKAYGDLLAGLAGGYGASEISQDDGDSSQADTGYGAVYASWGTRSWFADADLGFGLSSVDYQSGTLFDNAADFDATQVAFSLGGGREMTFRRDTVFLTPELGVRGMFYSQDGYSESSATAIPRNVEAYDRWSFRSEVGLKAALEKERKDFTLSPGAHVSWLHEFEADEQRVDYSLVGGMGRYSFGMAAPVEDLIEAGLGLSLWAENKKGAVFEYSFGLDGRFGDGYTAAGLNARMLVEF